MKPSSLRDPNQPPIPVLLLHNIMAPYRFPLFQELSKSPGVELMVNFMSASAKNRRWQTHSQDLGFSFEVLPNWQLNFFGKDLFTYILNYTFPWRLWRSTYQVIISAGWLDFACQAAFFISQIQGRRFIVWCESTAGEPSWRRSLAQPLVRLMVSRAQACIAVGTRSREYLLELGAHPSQVFTAYSTVDTRLFAEKSQLSPDKRKQLMKKYGITGHTNLLFVGQFIERKGILTLLAAYEKLAAEDSQLGLILVGYGPQRTELETYIEKHSLSNVVMIDHLEPTAIAQVYGLADVFVLPSVEETWGLVVNEAMAAGLPVVVSSAVGSAVDLVQPGVNGFMFESGNATDLQKHLALILKSESRRKRMGIQSSQLITQFTPAAAAEAFTAAIKYCMEDPNARR